MSLCCAGLLPPNKTMPSAVHRGLMEKRAPLGVRTPYEFWRDLVPDQERGGMTLLHLGSQRKIQCLSKRHSVRVKSTDMCGVGRMKVLNSGRMAEAYALVAWTTVGVVIEPRSVLTTH